MYAAIHCGVSANVPLHVNKLIPTSCICCYGYKYGVRVLTLSSVAIIDMHICHIWQFYVISDLAFYFVLVVVSEGGDR